MTLIWIAIIAALIGAGVLWYKLGWKAALTALAAFGAAIWAAFSDLWGLLVAPPGA